MENTKYKEIIEYIARNKLIETIISNCKIADDDLIDLSQDIYLYLLEKHPPQLLNAYNKGELNNYLSRIVTNNIYSKTSRYFYKYKKHKLQEIELNLEDEVGD